MGPLDGLDVPVFFWGGGGGCEWVWMDWLAAWDARREVPQSKVGRYTVAIFRGLLGHNEQQQRAAATNKRSKKPARYDAASGSQPAGLASQFQRCPARQSTHPSIQLTPCLHRIHRPHTTGGASCWPPAVARRPIPTCNVKDKRRLPDSNTNHRHHTMAAVTPSHAPHAAGGKPTIPTSEQQQQRQRQQLEKRQQATPPWGPPDWVSE